MATARDERVTFLAAAIAYYALVSLFPLVLLALAAASAFGGKRLAVAVLAQAGSVLSPVEADLVRATLVTASGRGGATVVGLGLLLWSGLKLFRGLDVAFDEIYETDGRKSFLERLRDALIIFGGVAVGLGAAIVVGFAVALSGVRVGVVVANAVLVVVLAAVFFPVYYLAPDRTTSVRDTLPGTVLAAVGWTVLGAAFGLYAERATAFELYGLVGAVLLLVTWYYVGAVVLLVGATLNAVLGGHIGSDRQLQQASLRDDDRER
ncbi:MAG: YihY/virulence factor BrkB family protein [Haloarculaceae archaeon]